MCAKPHSADVEIIISANNVNNMPDLYNWNPDLRY